MSWCCVVFFTVAGVVGYFLGRACRINLTKSKLHYLSDDWVQKAGRSEKQVSRDAVLQLQNEIAASGALVFEEGKVGIIVYVP